jgi:hypothetical protein
MVLGDSSKYIDFITNHMLTAFHQILVDDFHSIVLASLNLMFGMFRGFTLLAAENSKKLTCMASSHDNTGEGGESGNADMLENTNQMKAQ